MISILERSSHDREGQCWCTLDGIKLMDELNFTQSILRLTDPDSLSLCTVSPDCCCHIVLVEVFLLYLNVVEWVVSGLDWS